MPVLPPYLPPWNGKANVPKDLDAAKSTLQTLLLPDEIRFEGLLLGWVQNVMFEDLDLGDNKKFPNLAIENLLP